MKVTEIDYKVWTERLQLSDYRSSFHDIEIMNLFMKVIGGRYTLFSAVENDKEWLIPIFQGRPWVTNPNGFVTSSVGYGGPLPIHKVEFVVDEIERLKNVIKELEVYTGCIFLHGQLYPAEHWDYIPDHKKYRTSETLIMHMDQDIEETFKTVLSGSVRTAIRKAEKNNVSIRTPSCEKDLIEAHQLIINTQKRVGATYTTPFSIIENIFINNNFPAKIFLAVINEKIIGSVVLLENKVHSFHWLHGWDKDYSTLCGNQMMIWFMAKFCSNRHCLKLNLGANHTMGQQNAKMKWGAKPTSILTLSRDNIFET